MDRQNFDPFNLPAWLQVEHAVSEEPQTDQAGQDGFEQHLAEANQTDSAPVASEGRDNQFYPHLSEEDRDIIDRAITQYATQKNPQPSTIKFYTQALRRLGNDLRARGQTTDLRDHRSLLDHVNSYFPRDVNMKTGVGVLRAYRDSGHIVSRGRPRTIPSAKDASSEGQPFWDEPMVALARSNVLPSEEVLINFEQEAAQSRAAKRPRKLNNSQTVVIERQPTEIATSGEGGGAMPAASALQPAESTGIVGQRDEQPLYPEDAPDILRLKDALIEGGMTSAAAKQYVSCLLGFSRWLFAKNRPSIVARMDSKSLSDGGDIHEFAGEGTKKKLLAALGHLRTLRSTGAPIVRPGRARANHNPPPPNVVLTNPESTALVGPRRLDDAAAQRNAPHEADSRLEELQEQQDDQPAPSVFGQELAAFDPEQLPQEQLRRVLDHLDDKRIPSPLSVVPEELQRLEKDLHEELHGRRDNHPAPSFSVDPEEFTFNPELFAPGELWRLLGDESASELEGGRDDQSAHPSVFVQRQVALDPEQLTPEQLRRVLDHLDDQPIPSPVSVAPEELQRLEKDLHEELHGRRDNHPAPSFSIDPEEFTFNPELFSSGELWRR
ncbi:hypothetical protein J4G48_0005915 [Bradyrhizobium barranii subsp. apii]|uniref:hypothetical protein n=1 Tax=Bradyrhizobium barranii TaxID=2992140 RepID=UPI001CD50D72|nr:hypothetical protein [Bradyrhizobium barranii]UPT97655.1 hypothetical protein J4G48_0005915 [Bradyrhizobium barranii subsp. apii]